MARGEKEAELKILSLLFNIIKTDKSARTISFKTDFKLKIEDSHYDY